MRKLDFQAKCQQLRVYPEQHFGESASERWLCLCSLLTEYHPASGNFRIDKERKWEVASALQKSIRRAEESTALRVIAATQEMPEEYAYFLRRLCVIACEDIGPGDDTLVKFVLACATLFSTQKPSPDHFRVLNFLTAQMCELPVRSRIYCSYEIITDAARNSALPPLNSDEKVIVDAIRQHKQDIATSTTRFHDWQRSQSWRTAGLLPYLGLSLPIESQVNTDPLPGSRIVFELPSYCYDMYTRIGLSGLRRIVAGVPGAESIRDFFQRNALASPHKVLGEALFTVEGGREQSELLYPALSLMEQRIFAHRFGLRFDDRLHLCDLTLKALQNGTIDRVREEVLRGQYGQGQLQLIAQTEEPVGTATN
jgi:hypothetical protein